MWLRWDVSHVDRYIAPVSRWWTFTQHQLAVATFWEVPHTAISHRYVNAKWWWEIGTVWRGKFTQFQGFLEAGVLWSQHKHTRELCNATEYILRLSWHSDAVQRRPKDRKHNKRATANSDVICRFSFNLIFKTWTTRLILEDITIALAHNFVALRPVALPLSSSFSRAHVSRTLRPD